VRLIYGFPGRGVPSRPELLAADVLARLAVAAEDAGWTGVSLDDHPIPPEYWRQGGDGHDGVDPFVALAAVAAATNDLRLFVHAVQVPLRNPFLLAKTVATLDVLSKGRVELGMVTGYLPEEYAALGVSYDERNRLFDESVEVMKRAWTGEPVSYEGVHFSAVDVCARPRPVQQPHPPLWIGGNSTLAFRRVVATGRGWIASWNRRGRAVSRHTAPLETTEDFAARLEVLHACAAEAGRTEPIEVSIWLPMRADTTVDELRRRADELEELGVGWVFVNHSTASSESEALDTIERVAAGVLAR
jgi:probable F420-dependent oxidoreductase